MSNTEFSQISVPERYFKSTIDTSLILSYTGQWLKLDHYSYYLNHTYYKMSDLWVSSKTLLNQAKLTNDRWWLGNKLLAI